MPRHQFADIGLVRVGARGREAERACAYRLFGQAAHLGDVLRVCRFATDAALAHDIDAQRMMRDLRRDIDRARQPSEGVEVFRKTLPLPAQAFGEGGAGNILDRLHQIDQAGAMLGPHRREADAAIAEQDRRDAVP